MRFERSHKLSVINSMVEITCALCESNPPSTLTWFYNGTQIDLNRHDVQVISTCSKESLYFRVLGNNGGNYTCVAKNVLGEARSTTEISPLGKRCSILLLSSIDCKKFRIKLMLLRETF